VRHWMHVDWSGSTAPRCPSPRNLVFVDELAQRPEAPRSMALLDTTTAAMGGDECSPWRSRDSRRGARRSPTVVRSSVVEDVRRPRDDLDSPGHCAPIDEAAHAGYNVAPATSLVALTFDNEWRNV